MCCKTGLPRTSIIGFGKSAVSSRMRVPRPAASNTALSIFVTTASAKLRRFRFFRRLGLGWRDNQARQVRLFDHVADLVDVLRFELRPLCQLIVQLFAERLKNFEL